MSTLDSFSTQTKRLQQNRAFSLGIERVDCKLKNKNRILFFSFQLDCYMRSENSLLLNCSHIADTRYYSKVSGMIPKWSSAWISIRAPLCHHQNWGMKQEDASHYLHYVFTSFLIYFFVLWICNHPSAISVYNIPVFFIMFCFWSTLRETWLRAHIITGCFLRSQH